MKRAIIFILLKIAEIATLIFGPYLLGSIYYGIINKEKTTIDTWMCGVGMIVLFMIFAIVGILVVAGVLGSICLNLDFAKYLAKKSKK